MRNPTARSSHSAQAGTTRPANGNKTRTTRLAQNTTHKVLYGLILIILGITIGVLLGVMKTQNIENTPLEIENDLTLDTSAQTSFGVEINDTMYYTPEEVEVLFKQHYGYEVVCSWYEYQNVQNESVHFLKICDPYNGELYGLDGILTENGGLLGECTWKRFVNNNNLEKEMEYAKNPEFLSIEDMEVAIFESVGHVVKVKVVDDYDGRMVAYITFNNNAHFVYEFVIEDPEKGVVTTQKSIESICDTLNIFVDATN